ncbi:MAG TPA: EamA family transporter [Actinomycetota bacterium]|nr:EamA family transporter [Actinomycetota bacterium]
MARRGAAAGVAAVAAAALLWAIGAALARRLFDAGVTPLELTEARAAIAAAGLALAGGARRVPRPLSRPRLAAFGMAIATVTATYYEAIARIPVAVAIVVQYTAPALVVLYAAVAARRRPDAVVGVVVVVAIAGVALVAGLPGGAAAGVDGAGLAFAGASAVMFATYTVLAVDAGRAYGPVGAMFRAFAIAAAFWIAMQTTQGWPHALFDPALVPRVVAVAVAGTLVPFLLFVWGAQRLAAERASVAATLEPVFAALVAWLWLDQSLAPAQVAGGALIVAAVAALQVRESRPVVAYEP